MMHITPKETLKARKPHQCSSCGESIPTGETYFRWRSYDHGDAFTNKMHPECFKMHEDDSEGGQWEYSPYSHERPPVAALIMEGE